MTTTTPQDRSAASLDSLFQSLASERRRTIVDLVADASATGLTKADLAERLAAVTNDNRSDAVTDAERSEARVALTHCDLPALREAGLLTERDDGTVVTTDHWIYEQLDSEAAFRGRPPDDLDRAFDALADERRRTVLSVLADEAQPITVRDLARFVAARETDATERSVRDDRVDRVLASLVHVHLPTLVDAGVVTHDRATNQVSIDDHPAVRSSWLEREDGSRTDDGSDITSRLAAIAPSSD